MYIQIIGLEHFEYLDLCAILGSNWCKMLASEDNMVNVSVNTEQVNLKAVLDVIFLHKGDKIAELSKDHFVKIEIM